MERLLIIDGHAYAYRAFHAIRGLRSPSGQPTNAIFGFVKMLEKMRAAIGPTHLIVVWDGGLSAERMTALPEYKAQRPPMPDDLKPQLDEMAGYLKAAGVASYCGEGVEADDYIACLARRAAAAGWHVVIASSDKDFMQLVSPQIGLWNPNDQAPAIWSREQVLAKTGVDAILVLPFDEALSRVTAEDFVRNVLVGMLQVRVIHEGGNFRFGHGAKAGISELRAFGETFDFTVQVHRAVRVHDLEVSSSAVRGLIADGDVRRARWMLSRVFGVHSHPAKGRGVGTKLLVPTVNLAPYEGLLPGFGVYVTRLTVGDKCFQAVTNVGNRPTFEGAGFGVETHILNFEPVDVSDETPLHLEFLLRLRGEIQWPSTEALKNQILRDVTRAKRYFRIAAPRQGDPSLR